MQPQPLRPAGWTVRRGTVLHAADRRMLQAVRDNLSHVRYAAAAAGTLPRRLDMDTHNGSCMTGDSSLSVASRLDYNKKAMDEIRQSLQNYHVTPSYDDTANSDVATQQLMMLSSSNKVSEWLDSSCYGGEETVIWLRNTSE